MKPEVEIELRNLEAVATLMNTLLADEYVLYTKTRNAHWNVQGPDFFALHNFFEKQYDELAEIVDEVAERVRGLGHFALGTMREFLEVTRLSEKTAGFGTQEQIIRALLLDHEAIIRELRRDCKIMDEEYLDAGSSDFCMGIMEQHEKMAWMLRSHLPSIF